MNMTLTTEQAEQLRALRAWNRWFVRILHSEEVEFYYRNMWINTQTNKTDCIGEIVGSRKVETPVTLLIYTVRFADGTMEEFNEFQFQRLYGVVP